jgi:hypothetical protein
VSTLGRYRLVRLLATGGMGEAYLAQAPTGEPVVLKRVLRHLANDLTFLERLEAEAALSALVLHPHVARVFGLERANGDVFLVQEYVHGLTLDAFRKACGGRLPTTTAVTLVAQLLRGLAAVHEVRDEQGRPLRVVHGDVSPTNALVGFDGSLRLVDFGAARPAGDNRERFATLAYAAPEARLNQNVDARADVFAAGRVLTELVTGSLEGTQWPRGLQGIVERAVAEEPAQRFSTARHFAEALEAWYEGQTDAYPVKAVLREAVGATAMQPLNLALMRQIVPRETTTRLKRSTFDSLVALQPVKPKRRWVWVVAGVLAALSAIGWVLWPTPSTRDPVLSVAAADTAVERPQVEAASADAAVADSPDADVSTGVIRVVTLARTEVWINGVKVGRAPLAPQTVPAGTLEVILKGPRATKRFSVSLEAGREVTITWPAKRRRR